jgi:hypothetical protein
MVKVSIIVAVSLWLGAMGAFALVVAPVTFGTLERAAAGALVVLIISRLEWIGLVLGAVALLAAVLDRRGPRARRGAVLVLLAAMVGWSAYGVAVVTPELRGLWGPASALRRAGDLGAPAVRRFDRLHAMSRGAFAGVMVAGAAVIALCAAGAGARPA